MSSNMERFTAVLKKPSVLTELAKLNNIETATKIVRIAMTELRKNEYLTTCDPQSFLGAIFQATQLNLSLDTNLQHAAIVPYKGKCQLQLMYRGCLKLAHETGLVSYIEAHMVKENDIFHFEREMPSGKTIMKHVPAHGKRGDIKGVYALIHMKDGHTHFEFMDYEEITKARECSQNPYKTPKGFDSVWTKNTDAMSKKTVIKQAAKYLPLGENFSSAVILDDLVDAGVDQENDKNEKVIDLNQDDYQEIKKPKKSTADNLADALEPEVFENEPINPEEMEAGARG